MLPRPIRSAPRLISMIMVAKLFVTSIMTAELIGEAPATPPKTKRRRKASTAAKAAKKAATAAAATAAAARA